MSHCLFLTVHRICLTALTLISKSLWGFERSLTPRAVPWVAWGTGRLWANPCSGVALTALPFPPALLPVAPQGLHSPLHSHLFLRPAAALDSSSGARSSLTPQPVAGRASHAHWWAAKLKQAGWRGFPSQSPAACVGYICVSRMWLLLLALASSGQGERWDLVLSNWFWIILGLGAHRGVIWGLGKGCQCLDLFFPHPSLIRTKFHGLKFVFLSTLDLEMLIDDKTLPQVSESRAIFSTL